MLVGNPDEIDGCAVEIAREAGEEVVVRCRANVPAVGAPRIVAGIHQDVTSVGQVNEDCERLVHVVEVDG